MEKETTETTLKPLTVKQERFCHEYVLCMNQSEAYRRAYDAKNMKPQTINKKAYELMQLGHIAARIEKLKNDVETVLGISKVKMIETLQEIIGRSLHGKAKYVWDPDEKRLVPETTDDGNIVYEYDSNGANKAVEQIMKAMGYNAPEKQDITSGGKPLTKIVEVQ